MENLYDATSGVEELNMFSFTGHTLIQNKRFKGKNGLINFYVPWCKCCQEMKDMWIGFATEFGNRFLIVAVNCERNFNYNIGQWFNIKQYPTIKYIETNGTLHDYKGKIEKDAILEFISEHIIK